MTDTEANQIYEDLLTACRIVMEKFPVVPAHPLRGEPLLYMYGYPITKETAPFIATILRLSETIARHEEKIQTLEYDLQMEKSK